VDRRLNVLHLRVTKYNPSKRDRHGRYLAADFTSASDVGQSIGGAMVEAVDYASIEDGYVECVKRLLVACNVDILHVSELEDGRGTVRVNAEVERLRPAELEAIHESLAAQGDDIERIVRMNLRSRIWCRLSGDRGLYIHFGHDLYMYIECQFEDIDLGVPPNGIFYENYESPYF
jgi:hypothetical protein